VAAAVRPGTSGTGRQHSSELHAAVAGCLSFIAGAIAMGVTYGIGSLIGASGI